jgi:hypothetical protein
MRWIWWLNPGKLVLFFILPLYLFISLAVPEIWPDLVVLRANNYLRQSYVLLGAACLLVMGAACLVGTRIDLDKRPAYRLYDINERFLLAVGAITVLAYVIWFSPLVARGTLFLKRDELNQTPGVTSFSQLGVTFVVCYLYATLRARQRLSRITRALFWTILVLTVARVYIWSERLALIEMAVPAAVSLLAYRTPTQPLWRGAFRLVGRYGPFLALPLLMGFFMATEFIRSWSSDFYNTKHEFGEFMVSRLVTYYYTAINNGAGLLATSTWPDYDMVHVLNWFYRLPFGIGQLFSSALGRGMLPTDSFLSRFGDVEFTNMSGVFPIVHDLGFAGGLLYFSGFGVIAGMMYRALTKGRRVGILLFPPLFVACLEVLRIAYLNNPRSFVIVLSALFAITQFRPRMAPASARDPASAPETALA